MITSQDSKLKKYTVKVESCATFKSLISTTFSIKMFIMDSTCTMCLAYQWPPHVGSIDHMVLYTVSCGTCVHINILMANFGSN